MGTLLYGVEPSNPLVLAGAVLLFLVVSTLAAVRPARRAARLDPIVALRVE